MGVEIELYELKYNNAVYFLVTFIFITFWLIFSIIIGFFWDSNQFNFIVLFITFLAGTFIVGHFNELYWFRYRGGIQISEEGIKRNDTILPCDFLITIYYNNPKDWMKEWGWYGGYSKYKSMRWIGREKLLDRIILNGEIFYLKIKTQNQMKQFEQAVDSICALYPNAVLYYSSDQLRYHNGEDYWEKRM